MSDYTLGTQPIGLYKINSMPTPRRVVLMGPGLTLEQDLTLTSTTATAVGPLTVGLSWFLPAGTTSISIAVNYSAALDVSGARPKARLRANSAMGISEQTVNAPSGGGTQTITFTFSATSAGGNAIIDLIVPDSGLIGTTVWTPTVAVGTAASFGTGNSGAGNGNSGPIRGAALTKASASVG